MLVYGIQFGDTAGRAGVGGTLAPLLLIIGGACVGGLLLPLLRLLVTRGRASWYGRRARRARVHAVANAERRARALMSELCPYGWRAQITLSEGAAEQDSGEPVRGAVALDWFELRPGGGEPAVMRRVWAMVEDRRTDETLEQIELRASADGLAWPDL